MKRYTYYPMIERIREEPVFRSPKNMFLKILMYAGVFIVMSLAESFGSVALLIPQLFKWATQQMEENGGTLDSQVATEYITDLSNDPKNLFIMLLCTGFGTLVVMFFAKFPQGRRMRTIGFHKDAAVPRYLIGLIAGFVMFSAVVGIAYVMGGLKFEGYVGASIGPLLLIFLGYGLQGMSEEVLCRGFYMSDTLRHKNLAWAIGVNSVIFGLLHAANAGFTLLAFINLILYAVMISFYTLRTDSLWGACAVHSIWNFVQGNFYGLPVSGIDSGDSVFRMSLQGSVLANGGDFGLEASLATTIVMLAAIAVLLFVPLPFAVNRSKPADTTVPPTDDGPAQTEMPSVPDDQA